MMLSRRRQSHRHHLPKYIGSASTRNVSESNAYADRVQVSTVARGLETQHFGKQEDCTTTTDDGDREGRSMEELSKEELIALITKRDEELLKRDEELLKSREELLKSREEQYASSLNRIVKEGPPSMHQNQSCQASIVPNEKARKEWTKWRIKQQEWNERRVGDAPRGLGYHEPAEIFRRIVNLSRVNFTFEENNFQPSVLRTYANTTAGMNVGKLHHSNEQSPQSYIEYLFVDVLNYCGLPGVRVIREASIFSLRPDFVVVQYEGLLSYSLLLRRLKTPRTAYLILRLHSANSLTIYTD